MIEERIAKSLIEIKNIIEKNKDFLADNPDILTGIYDRLSKTVDDDAERWLRDNDPNFSDDDYIDMDEADSLYGGYQEDDGYGGEGDELFDNPYEPENDMGDEDAAYAQEAPTEYEQIDQEQPYESETAVSEPESVQKPVQVSEKESAPQKKKEVSSSGYTDWSPHGNYTPKQEKMMEEFQQQGYSPREAERLANAHRGPETFEQALTHRVRPSDISPKMMEELKGLTGPWLSNARKVSYHRAEAEKNPIKYAKGKTLKAHETAMGDYSSALKDWRNSDEVKAMSPRERYSAEREWKKQYHEQNPEHREQLTATASKGSEAHVKAIESRKQHIEDKLKDIMTAGMGEGGMSSQEAAQHVGGLKTDAGYSSSTIKDPAASFAEANPEYVKSLRDKLSQHLPEDAQKRLKNVDNAAKHLGVIRKPNIKGTNNGNQ